MVVVVIDPSFDERHLLVLLGVSSLLTVITSRCTQQISKTNDPFIIDLDCELMFAEMYVSEQ
jgi:hypothetical protein